MNYLLIKKKPPKKKKMLSVQTTDCSSIQTLAARKLALKLQPILVQRTVDVINTIKLLPSGTLPTYANILAHVSPTMSQSNLVTIIQNGLKTGVFKTTDNRTFLINGNMASVNSANKVYSSYFGHSSSINPGAGGGSSYGVGTNAPSGTLAVFTGSCI